MIVASSRIDYDHSYLFLGSPSMPFLSSLWGCLHTGQSIRPLLSTRRKGRMINSDYKFLERRILMFLLYQAIMMGEGHMKAHAHD